MNSAIPKTEKKKILKRYLILSLIIILLLSVWLTFSPFGIIKIYLLRKDIRYQEELNKLKEQEITHLRYQIEALKNPQLREDILREELGWVKKNELIYIFPEQKKQN